MSMKKSAWAILFPAAAFLVMTAAAAGCGSDGNGQDATEDQQTDVPHDPAADETAGDPATDEVSTDPKPDDVTAEDQSGDVPHPDVAPDPTDTPAEDVTYPACVDAGGLCTQWRWIICEAGKEPIDPDPNRDCPGSEGTRGWCCVDAPESTCSDSGEGNCVAATSCTGCWGPAREGLSCEEGRVCCTDICD
jgi:hypothetical protein